MISITKSEKEKLAKLFPRYAYPRTVKQNSKRHRYFCVEDEALMRAIADSNPRAEELVKEFDRARAAREARTRAAWRKK